MDLQKLEADLSELQRRWQEWHSPIYRMAETTRLRVGHGGYTEADREREIEVVYQQQLAVYNPRNASFGLVDEVVAAYIVVTAEERATIRDIFGKYWYGTTILYNYIFECIECLETAEDEDVFRLAMVAASIENYSSDYRDADGVLAELAIAAVKAGINMERHCTTIAELSSADTAKGGVWPMKQKLAQFHIYAPKAVRIFEDF